MPQTMLDKIAERIRVRRNLGQPAVVPLPPDTRQSPNQSPVQPTVSNYAIGARSFIPRAYQVQGIEFLRRQKRAILGDAPGLGKTFQATEAAELPCVISCPLPLVDQWKEFLEDQYPADPVSVAAYGNIVQRDAALTEFKERGGWLIMNHDLWRRAYIPDAATLIVDEMHHFKSKDPARSKMLLAYSKREGVERIYGLTATPVYKDVGDLWFQLHILDPKRWSSHWDFLQRFAVTSNYGYGVKVLRTRNKALLDRELEPYVIQRTYASVGMQLPERIDKHVILRMDAGEKKRYDTLRDFYRLQLGDEGEFKRLFNAGAVLHELRKMTITPKKLDEVAELVEEAQIATSRPVTVFVWYQDTAARVVEHLSKRGIEAVEITGELEPAKRRTLAQGSAVTVATMASLSEGVDLSYGRTVVFCETDYTPGRNYQALSRVIRHRTEGEATPDEAGATNTDPVVCYWCRYAGTVDQNIFETQKARTNGSALQVLKEALGMD
jgi:superfamily II DNA or RNA helicase